MEWEEIPDDVLVPTRTKRRRHRFREGFAPDVLLVGQTRRVRARVDDAFAALFTASDPRAREETARRGRARAPGLNPRARPAESSWDGEWTADHASAAVAEAADRDPRTPSTSSPRTSPPGGPSAPHRNPRATRRPSPTRTMWTRVPSSSARPAPTTDATFTEKRTTTPSIETSTDWRIFASRTVS